jgi:low temperature requirement protein LtrA
LAVTTWSDLIRPPRLQHSETDAGKQRTATWLELFFDLAFVLVVGELAAGLRNDLTLHGVLVFAGLFTSVWWAWAGFTFYANRFDTDDVVYRLAKLTAMLAVAGLAASSSDATGRLAAPFALCQAALRLVLVCLYLRAYSHVVQARTLIAVYVVAEGLAGALWLAGAVAPPPARYACWAVAVVAEAAAPIMATMRSAGLPLHFEHLPERFGLFVILVLGESVAAIAVGVHETYWEPVTVTVAALGFVVAVSLWWTYFDLAGAATTHTLADRGGHRSTLLHDIYAYGHWPIALGLAAAGAGLEGAILEGAQATLASGIRWVLCGGVALYLLALTAIQGGIAGSLRSGLPWPGTGAPLILAVGLVSGVRPVAVLAAVALVLVGEVVAGLVKQRRGTLTTPDPGKGP